MGTPADLRVFLPARGKLYFTRRMDGYPDVVIEELQDSEREARGETGLEAIVEAIQDPRHGRHITPWSLETSKPEGGETGYIYEIKVPKNGDWKLRVLGSFDDTPWYRLLGADIDDVLRRVDG